MNKLKTYMLRLSAVALLLGAWLLAACDDGVTGESYRTYDKEMLSDYLRNRDDFSMFMEVVTKAGLMDLLSTYGQYTCFAPTNDALSAYFEAQNISSIDDLSKEDCDTLARTAIVNRIYGLPELASVKQYLGKANMLDQPIEVEQVPVIENGDTVNTTFRINGQGTIIVELANDSVENGIVHPVDALVEPLRELLPILIERDPNVSIFNTCLQLTGLDKQMLRFRDESYDGEDWYHIEGRYQTGAADQRPYFQVPEKRYYGYTAFIPTDSTLNHYNEIAGYDKPITTWEDLYDYACTVYPEGAGSDYYGKEPEQLTDPRNPLYRLIAYHLLDRKGLYDKLTTYCTIFTGDILPTEWYSTMAPLSTMKVQMVNGKYIRSNKFVGNAEVGSLYINRHYDPNRPETAMRGAIVIPKVKDGLKQNGTNGVYYYVDRILDYGQEVRDNVFNTRMRIDLYTIWPEMMNNDLRSDVTNIYDFAAMGVRDTDTPSYIFPQGYLDNTETEADGRFLYMGPHHSFWSYEGDEFNLNSDYNTFDITFPLPSVPEGDYQIRLGFAPMDYRAIAQMYFDGVPQDIPLDMRYNTVISKIGTSYYGFSYPPSGDAWEQSKKDLHNLGWYHGPVGVRCGSNFDNDWDLSSSGTSPFHTNGGHTIRKVIYQGHITADKVHTLRMKSVWAAGTAQLMIDYIEIVPKNVYGVDGDGKGEDDY